MFPITICLIYINDGVSDTAFAGFQLIVTRGLYKKTGPHQHLTEHVLTNSRHPHTTCPSLSRRTRVHRLDSVVAGPHWLLLFKSSPRDSSSFQGSSHFIHSGRRHYQGMCPWSHPWSWLVNSCPVPAAKVNLNLCYFFFSLAYNVLHLWALMLNSITWKLSVCQNSLVGLLNPDW